MNTETPKIIQLLPKIIQNPLPSIDLSSFFGNWHRFRLFSNFLMAKISTEISSNKIIEYLIIIACRQWVLYLQSKYWDPMHNKHQGKIVQLKMCIKGETLQVITLSKPSACQPPLLQTHDNFVTMKEWLRTWTLHGQAAPAKTNK